VVLQNGFLKRGCGRSQFEAAFRGRCDVARAFSAP
jgi:hypothetical protein